MVGNLYVMNIRITVLLFYRTGLLTKAIFKNVITDDPGQPTQPMVHLGLAIVTLVFGTVVNCCGEPNPNTKLTMGAT